MDQSTKTNVLVGAFAVAVLAILAYGAVRLGPTGLGASAYKPLVVYVPSAAGLYEDSAVRIAGVKVGLVKDIRLERGQARVEIRLRQDVELYPNARATVRSEGLLGDRYIEINPGSPDPQAMLERAGPPEEEGVRIIYADEAGDIEQLTEQLGRTGRNLEAITDNLRAVLENRPGGNADLSQTLQALARLTTNLADITVENRQDLRELITHLRNISLTLDSETPQVASELRQLIGNLNGLVDQSRDDLESTLNSFRKAASSFERSLDNVEEITRKVNDGEGTIGRLINDETTVNEINQALEGFNSFIDFANRLELRLGYRAEFQPRRSDAKSVVSVQIWPKPDKFYFLDLVADPVGTRPKTRTVTITNNPGFGSFFPAGPIDQTTTSTTENGLRFSLGIGKRFEYVTVFGGLIENSGGVGLSVSPDRYKHWELELTAYDFNRSETNRPIVKARASFYFWKYFYLTGGIEDILAENTDDIIPFGGGGITFVEDDLKPLLSQVDISPSTISNP